MYILDTDHLSVLERGGTSAQRLRQRLANVGSVEVVTSIISYQEQTQGWLSAINKAKTVEQEVKEYKRLKQQLTNYCAIPILEFNERAAQAFQQLRVTYRRLGTMDLKIASIALTNQAILLTRNRSDFGQIAALLIEDWT